VPCINKGEVEKQTSPFFDLKKKSPLRASLLLIIGIRCEAISDFTDETGLSYACFNISSIVTISASPEQP
jgi:hypothetical protein